MSEDRNLNIGIKLARKPRTWAFPSSPQVHLPPEKPQAPFTHKEPSPTFLSALRLGHRLPLHSVIRSLTSSTDCFSTSIFLSNSLSLVLSILQ